MIQGVLSIKKFLLPMLSASVPPLVSTAWFYAKVESQLIDKKRVFAFFAITSFLPTVCLLRWQGVAWKTAITASLSLTGLAAATRSTFVSPKKIELEPGPSLSFISPALRDIQPEALLKLLIPGEYRVTVDHNGWVDIDKKDMKETFYMWLGKADDSPLSLEEIEKLKTWVRFQDFSPEQKIVEVKAMYNLIFPQIKGRKQVQLPFFLGYDGEEIVCSKNGKVIHFTGEIKSSGSPFGKKMYWNINVSEDGSAEFSYRPRGNRKAQLDAHMGLFLSKADAIAQFLHHGSIQQQPQVVFNACTTLFDFFQPIHLAGETGFYDNQSKDMPHFCIWNPIVASEDSLFGAKFIESEGLLELHRRERQDDAVFKQVITLKKENTDRIAILIVKNQKPYFNDSKVSNEEVQMSCVLKQESGAVQVLSQQGAQWQEADTKTLGRSLQGFLHVVSSPHSLFYFDQFANSRVLTLKEETVVPYKRLKKIAEYKQGLEKQAVLRNSNGLKWGNSLINCGPPPALKNRDELLANSRKKGAKR